MFRNVFLIISSLILIIFLPSCVKYYDMSKREFPQGKVISDQRSVVQEYLKTVKIFDQFKTLAYFDVLWLSDETRAAYVDLSGKCKGLDTQEISALRSRQSEENKHWITFYIIDAVGATSLTDKNAEWFFYLVTQSGEKIKPIVIKESEFETEYRSFFDYRADKYPIKRSYILKFPATNLAGQFYIKNGENFKMVVSSAKYQRQRQITWYASNNKSENNKSADNKNKKEKVLKNEDYYWV